MTTSNNDKLSQKIRVDGCFCGDEEENAAVLVTR